jgi:hypothetical protein
LAEFPPAPPIEEEEEEEGHCVKVRAATKLCIDVKYAVLNVIYIVKLTFYRLKNSEIFHAIILKT